MRVGLDATPLLGHRTGVGHYVAHLVDALASMSDGPDLTLTAFTARGAAALRAPPGHRVVHRRLPARALHEAWARFEVPPVELIAGRSDVFHATNFVLPPLHRAAGVVTIHDLAFLRLTGTVTAASRRYRELVPRSLRRARVVVCPAEATAADVADEYGLARDKVMITPLGVDDAWLRAIPLDPSARAGLGAPERYLLFVGSAEPRKRLPDLVAAHRSAAAASDAVAPLVLAGPSGWGPSVDAPGALRTGYLEPAVLRSLVAGATALVLPSQYEGFGLPLLEAMACGTPVVATDIPVHREVTGGLGRLVPVGDVEALAAALVSVSEDPLDAAANRRRRDWAAAWTWTRCAALTLAAYRRALG